jgi:hypothetical protein
MSRYFFDHGTGRLSVHLVSASKGFLDMHLRLHTGVDRVTEVDEGFEPTGSSSGGGELVRRRLEISGAFCPFPQMIAWLEAVSLGLHQCGLSWDAEGPLYKLRWNGAELSIEEYADEPPEELRVRLDRRQMVAAFYLSFRRFVGSRRYRPAEYEKRRFGEIMVEAEGHGLTEDELRGRLLTLTAAELEPTLQKWHLQGCLASEQYADEFPGAYRDPETRVGSMRLWRFPYVTREWDGWDTPRRRARIGEIFDLVDDGYFGTPLRGLRSEIVERFLGAEEKRKR